MCKNYVDFFNSGYIISITIIIIIIIIIVVVVVVVIVVMSLSSSSSSSSYYHHYCYYYIILLLLLLLLRSRVKNPTLFQTDCDNVIIYTCMSLLMYVGATRRDGVTFPPKDGILYSLLNY